MNSTNQASLIERLEGQLYGMQLAHKLITEFENSAIDHYARELDLLAHRITKLKSENFSIPCVSPRTIEFCFINPDGTIDVRYRRQSDTTEANQLIKEHEDLRKRDQDKCPYFYWYVG